MGCCSAPNCTNSSEKNFRMFRFPSNLERRSKWIANCRRERWVPGPNAQLCSIHFEETQFELHRQDGWKKLKPNAVPTLFPEPTEPPKVKKTKATARKRKRSPSSDDDEVVPKKKPVRRKIKPESSLKKKKLSKKKSIVVRRKKHKSLDSSSHSQSSGSQKRKQASSDNSQHSQKENLSPRLRKSPRPRKLVTPPASDSSTEEEDYNDGADYIIESDNEESGQKISSLRLENESMKQEISEFEKHNKAMSKVILELEKHNKLMGMKLVEMDKDNKVLTKRVSDLERQNEDLKSKLNCCFSEEQIARMDKMRQLGTIERYIPAFK